MLQRSSQIGEFYRMAPPQSFDTSKRLPKTYMDIMVYDEESDRHVHIEFIQALYATGYGSDDGPRGDLFNLANLDATRTSLMEANSGAASTVWQALGTDITKAANPAAELAAIRAVVSALVDAVNNGQWVPVELVIARPFIEHLMLSAIVTVSGRDTGATLFGPADMRACRAAEPLHSERRTLSSLLTLYRLCSQRSPPTPPSRRSKVRL